MGADGTDLTVTLDENNPRASRIVYNVKRSEDQAPPASGAPTDGIAVGDGERDKGPTGERF